MSILGMINGVATGIGNYFGTQKMNETNNLNAQHYWNERLQKSFLANENAANNAQKRMYQSYFDLQSPKAMVEQLKKAGLNPALMYSQGGMGGQTTSAPQGTADGNGGINPLGLQQIIDPLTMAKIKNIEADTKNKEADTDKKKEETKTEIFNQNLINSKTELNEIRKQIDNNNLTISTETINDIITKTKTEAQQAIEELTKLKLTNGITKETYNEQITKIKQDSINTITQGEIMQLEKDKIKATTENIEKDTEKKEKEIEEIKWKCKLLNHEISKKINEINLTYYMTLSEDKKAKYYETETTRIATEMANKYGWTFTKEDIYRITEQLINGTGMIFGISTGSAVVNAAKPKMGQVGF